MSGHAAPADPYATSFTPPYPPSWVDLLTAAVDRLPWPWWLSYLALGLAIFLTTTLIQLATGDYNPGRYLAFHVWSQAYLAYLLALLHALDRSAAGALQSFRPVLLFDTADQANDESFEDLAYRLTTLPPRPALLAAGLGGLFGTILPLFFVQSQLPGSMLARAAAQFGFSTHPVVLMTVLLTGTLATAVVGVFVYHTIHQLRWIDRIYRQFTNVNLFRLPPLFSFSRTTALTAAGLALYNYGWFGTAPGLTEQPVGLALGGFFLVVTLITFFWPLYGAHRRLESEKRHLLTQVSRRFEAAAQRLHEGVDSGELAGVDGIHKAMVALDLEQTVLRRIPTWPWEPGTLRSMLTALLLPITIWIIQTALGRLLD